ncbi:MAG: hypothetical protein L0387_33445 [Acidobacteria bacterium]|nr:hypothetical protein [Acidobacteriota bacterium]
MSAGPSAWDRRVPVAQREWRLEIAPRATTPGSHFNGYVSVKPLSLTGAVASVEVAKTALSGAETVFALVRDSNNWYRFAADGSRLKFERSLAGVQSGTSVALDGKKHRFWRFRQDASNGRIYWETSQNGLVWNVEYSESTSVPLGAVHVELSAGTHQAVASPGTAIFDNLRVASN